MLFVNIKGFRLRIDKILCYEPIDRDDRFYIEYRLVDESYQLSFKLKEDRDLALSRLDSILSIKE